MTLCSSPKLERPSLSFFLNCAAEKNIRPVVEPLDITPIDCALRILLYKENTLIGSLSYNRELNHSFECNSESLQRVVGWLQVIAASSLRDFVSNYADGMTSDCILSDKKRGEIWGKVFQQFKKATSVLGSFSERKFYFEEGH